MYPPKDYPGEQIGIADPEIEVKAEALTHPKRGEYLLQFLPKQYRDSVLGDLEERFPVWCDKYGIKGARQLYWWHVLTTTGYAVSEVVGKLVSWFWKLVS